MTCTEPEQEPWIVDILPLIWLAVLIYLFLQLPWPEPPGMCLQLQHLGGAVYSVASVPCP